MPVSVALMKMKHFRPMALTITFHGVSAHPGYAKDKLVNAMKVAGAFLNHYQKIPYRRRLRKSAMVLYIPCASNGIAEKVTLEFIIRDFKTAKLAEYENLLKEKLAATLQRFPGQKPILK